MGYSARYHAASLAAVFLALAVGILIGAGLGEGVLSDTEENLRESLEGDIEKARGEADELQAELDRERAFSARAYPALVGDTLEGTRIGLLAFGELPSALGDDVRRALEPSGGELVEAAVVRLPPDRERLSSELGQGRLAAIEEDPEAMEELGAAIGNQFAAGEGKLLDRVRDIVFSRSSGEGGRLDGVVLVRAPLDDPEPGDAAAAEALERGISEAVADAGAAAVAVERSDAPESAVPFFGSFDVATVDSVDLTSGQVAMVFALLGAKGSFGIKETADSLVPELLEAGQRGDRGR